MSSWARGARKYSQIGFNAYFELLQVYFGISVYVKSAQDCNKLVFGGPVPSIPQEPSNVVSVEPAIVPIINRLKSFLNVEIIRILQMSLQLINTQLVAYLLEKQLAQRSFNFHR
jgi:hypothetical protein